MPSALLLGCGGGLASPATPPSASSNPPSDLQAAALGAAALQQTWYQTGSGDWNTDGWWNNANSLTAIELYTQTSGSTQWTPVIGQVFTRNSGGGFLNNYYDDEGWWALAWIEAYDLTKNPTYLNTAASIFSDMTTGWDNVCGGGIWWSKARTYKNAIANELFLTVAARLARRVPNASQQTADLSWARQEWLWFSASGMINAQNLINDGLTSTCANNQKTTWTYNQGVILGGLVSLYRQTQDNSLLSQAQSVAGAAIANLAGADGILHDPCEPNCGPDSEQFKGIFTRNLAVLNAAAPLAGYASFLQNNAQSIWDKDRASGNLFGQVWSGPLTPADAITQTSALDALIAAAAANPDANLN